MKHSIPKAPAAALMVCSMSMSMSMSTTTLASPVAESAWADAWSASPDSAGRPLKGQTLRQIARSSIAGSSVRIRLSNLFGRSALGIGAAHVAVHASGSSIRPETDRALTFAGKPSVTIATGADVLSDPLEFPVGALEELAISLYLPAGATAPTLHSDGNESTFHAPGDAAAATKFRAGQVDAHRYFLTDIEVRADSAHAIVIVGDSIVDGYHSTRDRNTRWPDALATRLQADPAFASIAVVNAGISGNRIIHDGPVGPSALARFERDALSKPGVDWILLQEGMNDIGSADEPESPEDRVSAEQIIAGMTLLIARAHARGIKVGGATLLPWAGAETPLRYSQAGEAKRQTINAWIRNAGAFDTLVDFERSLRDPSRPDRLLAAYDSGDHLHPNDAGYKAMAACVDLHLFAHDR
jgi:lysophospholipase L1-like esterase